MAYQVLARKWRPQDFASVIGQDPIVTALRNALTEGRIAQAYLFSGIRGVGKTSVARILAKALNCERGPAADPCNECTTCREITSGADFDVQEVDAATYSKVEQVRELTESLKYQPARDRYKVVIVDEIHRLSRQAFDALLKIVEEPPPYLVFIFATTESEAVPATILSRCQEYRFRRVPAEVLARHLAELAEREEIEVGEAALRLLARAGDGSVRDSVALLDQLATFGSGSISDEEAARVLGGVDHSIFHRLLAAILAGEPARVGEVVKLVESEGWDPRHVFGEFLAYCRDALHLALGGGAPGLPREAADALAELVRGVRYENLLRLLHQLLESEAAVRRSEAGALALEIAWLRGAELPKLVRVEELLAGGSTGGATGGPTGAGGGAARGGGRGPARDGGSREAGGADGAGTAGATRSSPPRSAAGDSAGTDSDEARTVPSTHAAARTETPRKATPRSEAPRSETPRPGESEGGQPQSGQPRSDEPRADRLRTDEPRNGESRSAESRTSESRTAESRSARSHTAETAAAESASPEPSSAAGTPPAPRAKAAAPSEPGDVPPPEPPPDLEPPAGAPRSAVGAPGAADASAEVDSDTPADAVARFLERVSVRKQLLAAHLGEAQRLAWAGGRLEIHAEPDDPWLTRDRLRRESNRRVLERALAEVWGDGAGWKLVAAAPREPEGGPEPDRPEVDEAASHPRVQAVLDIFDGSVESVQLDQSPGEG